jgi:hypothetical protein
MYPGAVQLPSPPNPYPALKLLLRGGVVKEPEP